MAVGKRAQTESREFHSPLLYFYCKYILRNGTDQNSRRDFKEVNFIRRTSPTSLTITYKTNLNTVNLADVNAGDIFKAYMDNTG